MAEEASADYAQNRQWLGAGDTEDEAILDYCARHNLKHWTLE